MTDTYTNYEEVIQRNASANLAIGHTWDAKFQCFRACQWRHLPASQGCGNVVSCVSDYAKWIRMMILHESPLSKDAHRELVRPRILTAGPDECTSESDSPEGYEEKPFDRYFGPAAYALGWQIQHYRGHNVISHAGVAEGFGSLVCFLPSLQWGITIFMNAEDAYNVAAMLCYILIDEALGVPESEQSDWLKHGRSLLKEEGFETDEDPYDGQLPTIPLPFGIPLESCAGTYQHHGYRSLIIQHVNGLLFSDCFDREDPFTLTFKHASGAYFVVDMCYFSPSDYRNTIRAEFRIGTDGTVQALGLALENHMQQALLWFERLAQKVL